MSLMVKIAVMGETESVKGFAAAGIDIFLCDRDGEAEAVFRRINSADYGIIYVTERFAPLLEREIEIINRRPGVSVVLIPGAAGSVGAGAASLSDAVEKAVGSDIAFNI